MNINATDIADGRPSIVLGLIWTIILYFQVTSIRIIKQLLSFCKMSSVTDLFYPLQIEELTSNLPALQALSNSASSVDSMANSKTDSPPMKRKVTTKLQGGAKKALLGWVQSTATRYVMLFTNSICFNCKMSSNNILTI